MTFDTLNIYTTPDDYYALIGDNLNMILQGSSMDNSKAAERYIYQIERSLISKLTVNYNFTESMITANEHVLKLWKQAIIYQVEHFVESGFFSAKDLGLETSGELNSWLLETSRNFLRQAGLMNIVRYH
jgi:hypothetical protein